MSSYKNHVTFFMFNYSVVLRGYMQVSWKSDYLHFLVYSKENQTIKYVNKESCHRQSVFKAVPAGVFTRLGRLTLLTKSNQNTPILDFYLLHHEALKKANLLPKNVPTLKELHQQEDDRRRCLKKKKKKRKKGKMEELAIL